MTSTPPFAFKDDTYDAQFGRTLSASHAAWPMRDFAGGGVAALRDAMIAPTTLVDLTAAEGAGGHCGGIGQKVWEARVYEWLAGVVPVPA